MPHELTLKNIDLLAREVLPSLREIWDDEAGLCRPAFRHGRPPASRHILIGFRCAADAP